MFEIQMRLTDEKSIKMIEIRNDSAKWFLSFLHFLPIRSLWDVSNGTAALNILARENSFSTLYLWGPIRPQLKVIQSKLLNMSRLLRLFGARDHPRRHDAERQRRRNWRWLLQHIFLRDRNRKARPKGCLRWHGTHRHRYESFFKWGQY